jgi:hypothetical protein
MSDTDAGGKQNIGELADESLGNLTVLEELVDDLDRDHEIYDEQLERAKEHLRNAQANQNEILSRFEKQVGPI